MTELDRFSPFARLVRLVILAWAICALVPAHAAQYGLAPPPAWVVPRAVPEVATDAQAANSARHGEVHLLSDTQVRIEPDGVSVYKHFASKALDGKGVHGIADISIEFDPSYEKLTLHAVTIVRGGRVIDKLRQARIQVLQRERELEYRILDGSRTLSVILDDVRVGDTVEYAYSRSGVNPALRNRVAGASDMQWSVPVARVAVRLLAPQGRQLAVGLHGGSLRPTVREVPGFREYEWTQDSVPALRVDDGAPSDYDPYPFVYWSDFADWANVVQWALPLYRLAPRFGPELDAVIEQVRQENQAPEARLLAVLKLVQRDIRYFGVEAGQGGYIPRPPDLVYKRRFGDCKDKALLMVAMLRAVGVDAAPALVNTTLNGAIQDRPPGPGAFDHVVVRATIGDNTYWLDPTRSSQNGTLGNLTQADFGMALVLAPDSKGLVSMRNPAGSRSFKAIHAVFDARAGLGHPVAYSVTTTFSGVAADRVRAFMSSRSKEEIEGDYLNFYARGYANIRKAAPIEIREDNDVNTVTTVEHYLIDDFWGEPRDDGRRTGYVHASEIDTLLKTPDQLNRTAPLNVAFPAEVDELTEVKLPGSWNVHPKKVEIHNAAFDFRHEVAAGTGDVTYVLTDHYEALAREVAPGDVRAYADDVKRADDAVGLTLHWDGSTTRVARAAGRTSLATPVGAIALLVTWALLAAGCVRSCPAHSAHDWYLFRHAVWISGALWLIATAAHPGWKSHTMAIAVAYFGACKLLAGRAGAPESHWLFALDDGAALARRSWLARMCLHGLAFTPVLMIYAACGYYVWALLS